VLASSVGVARLVISLYHTSNALFWTVSPFWLFEYSLPKPAKKLAALCTSWLSHDAYLRTRSLVYYDAVSLRHHHFCIPEIEIPILGFFPIPLVKSFVLMVQRDPQDRCLMASKWLSYNFKVPQDLPLPNKAYLGCLSFPNMAYIIKHMAHTLATANFFTCIVPFPSL